MKDHRRGYFIVLMMLFIAASAFASSSPNVIITLIHPERFTDFRVQGRTEQESAMKFAAEPVKLPYEEFYFEKQTLISWIKNKIGGQEPNLTVREKR